MKNQNGFTLFDLLVVMAIVFGVCAWVWNAVKLVSCDFESNYKCEALVRVSR